MRYKCNIHRTNDGYYDEEGVWHCWRCYYENKFFNPRGVVGRKFTYKDRIQIRIVMEGNHNAYVEVWDIKEMKRLLLLVFPYMSQALREMDRIIDRVIEEGVEEFKRRLESFEDQDEEELHEEPLDHE